MIENIFNKNNNYIVKKTPNNYYKSYSNLKTVSNPVGGGPFGDHEVACERAHGHSVGVDQGSFFGIPVIHHSPLGLFGAHVFTLHQEPFLLGLPLLVKATDTLQEPPFQVENLHLVVVGVCYDDFVFLVRTDPSGFQKLVVQIAFFTERQLAVDLPPRHRSSRVQALHALIRQVVQLPWVVPCRRVW